MVGRFSELVETSSRLMELGRVADRPTFRILDIYKSQYNISHTCVSHGIC